MLQYNDEARGYIKLDGTRIQYPIVEHSDNDFYLKKVQTKYQMAPVPYSLTIERQVLMAKCVFCTVITCLTAQCLKD